ncbi:MAG: hypothetical protein ACI4OI_06300, partial [Gemmiger sp.]
MKRILCWMMIFALAFALAAPVLAEDPTPTPQATPYVEGQGVYVTAATVTDRAGGEIAVIERGDVVNVVLR